MNFLKFFCLPLLTFISLDSGAMVISDERGIVEIDPPTTWKYEKNLMGLPHVLLSPGEEKKTSVSVTITGIENAVLSIEDLKKNQKSYQTGRIEWAKKRDVSITRFHPYSDFKTKDKVTGHQIGVDYKIGDAEQSEMSVYVECPQSFIHLKAVGPSHSQHTKDALNFMRTIRCKI